MKAGIDFGSTVTKATWLKKDGSYGLLSTADLDGASSGSDEDVMSARDKLFALLALEGVTHARATGIGSRKDAGLPLVEPSGDPIADEIALQADGARRLIGEGASGDLLLVSIGTGTSYTAVRGGIASRFPFGNAIGGGFIAGVAHIAWFGGCEDVGNIGAQALLGRPQDILVKDLVPAAAGTMQGEFVVSHFGKFGKGQAEGECVDSFDAADRLIADLCATLVHCVAVTVIRDVMMIGMIEGFGPVRDVVFVGTPVARIARLREDIARYASALGMQARFPANGEYAAAIGALHAE